MSILNLASDGLPNVLVVLYDALARSTRPVARDELLESIAPEGVAHEGGKQARQTLGRWTDLGLFVQNSDGIELAQRPNKRADNDADLIAQVRAAARARALHPENNADLWAIEGSRAADFTRSIAWALAQEVYRTLYVSHLEALERGQLMDGTPALMQNNTRRSGLKAWGQFLGFLRPTLKPEIEVDPTVAIRDVLPDLQQPGQSQPVADFVNELCAKLPVLDAGVWRREVQARVRQDALRPLAEGQLSSSLSRAMLTLMRNEEIFLENRADTRSGVVLTGQAGIRADLRYTWIRRADARRAAA
jgi:hypothetical protein